VDVTVSVVVPVSERPQPLADLYEEYAGPIRDSNVSFEFVFVTQPSFRPKLERLAALREHGEPIHLLEVAQPVGDAVLVKLGAARARGSVIVTLPSYRRVEAEAIPRLISEIEGGADLATARRSPRVDSWINRLQSRVFHLLLGRLVGGRLHDIGCGVHAMRRELLDEIRLYGDFYRFLPLLAIREGYGVKEVPAVQHRADRGTRIYRPGIYLRRLIDIVGVFFLVRFTEKPLRFFGLVGSGLSLAGGGVLFVLLVQRLAGQGIADRPLLLLGVLLVVLGVQAIALGLIGEIIVHLHAGNGSRYRVVRREEAGADELAGERGER
jgi:hypothetical protein